MTFAAERKKAMCRVGMRRPLWLSLLVVAAAVRLSAADADVLDQLKTQFNKDQGVLRLVVLVSPTCPGCVGGAGWIEDYVLKRYPNLPIKVYAVWFEMYPGDSPKAFPAAQKLLPDRRVTHWWDESKNVGRWFYDVVPTNTKGLVQWDAFYLYGEDATWGDQQPAPLLTWGRTILNNRKKLTDKIAELAGLPTAPAVQVPAPPANQ
jgi:hypothetical protein